MSFLVSFMNLILLAGVASLGAFSAFAQTNNEDTTRPEATSYIEENPFMSARAAAMGGGLSTLADDLDAAFYNPAGIGGRLWGKTKPPFVRKLYFPHLGVSANTSSRKLFEEHKAQGGFTDRAVGQALMDASADKRQYARVTANTGIVMGRTMIVPYSDTQTAAVSRGNGVVETRYRSMSGIGFGTSVTDPDEKIALGYFGYTANRKETEGEFLYEEIINKESRSALLKERTVKYNGAMGHNLGLLWRLQQKAAPTIGLAITDFGNTTYKSGDNSRVVSQNTALGFSLSPSLGKHFVLNFNFEANRLSDADVTLSKKLRSGMELLFDGMGSYATAALRSGVNAAGVSYGAFINLGLLAFEATDHPVDIGFGNERVIERRLIGTLFVNVSEF